MIIDAVRNKTYSNAEEKKRAGNIKKPMTLVIIPIERQKNRQRAGNRKKSLT